MSIIVIYEILHHFVNTLTAHDKYSLPNSGNLRQAIQLELSNKWIIFSKVSHPFLKSISIFKHIDKKRWPSIACILSKIKTAKNVVRQMSKNPPFRTPFNSQHVKGSQTLAKSAWKQFCQSSSSLWGKLSRNLSLLVICEILGHFVNTFIPGDKHSLRNSENLLQPIKIQLSRQQKHFSSAYESYVKFRVFGRKRWPS